jgi:hypothetical protein
MAALKNNGRQVASIVSQPIGAVDLRIMTNGRILRKRAQGGGFRVLEAPWRIADGETFEAGVARLVNLIDLHVSDTGRAFGSTEPVVTWDIEILRDRKPTKRKRGKVSQIGLLASFAEDD